MRDLNPLSVKPQFSLPHINHSHRALHQLPDARMGTTAPVHLTSISPSPPPAASLSPITPGLLSASELDLFNSTCKWDHAVFFFLCLAHFTVICRSNNFYTLTIIQFIIKNKFKKPPMIVISSGSISCPDKKGLCRSLGLCPLFHVSWNRALRAPDIPKVTGKSHNSNPNLLF